MSRILLNTIALDPLRWAWPRHGYYRLADLIGKIATQTGFASVEIWQYHLSVLSGDELDEVKSALRRHGIGVDVVGGYPVLAGDESSVSIRDLRALFATAAELGASSIKIFVGNEASGEISDEVWAKSLESLDTLIRAATELGLEVNGETHQNTLFDDILAVEHVLTAIGKGRMGVCFQPYDFADSDGTIETLRKLAPDVRHLHIQGRTKDGDFGELEAAPIDYRRLLGILARCEFQGPMSIEFVKDCIVADPADFDLDLVLANAEADRVFLERIAMEAGVKVDRPA
jgi:sugar phosphate isomerase/epimerase